ncbi:hypothetical protein OJJOAM_001348 [Cupriavidus sp. H18C1]
MTDAEQQDTAARTDSIDRVLAQWVFDHGQPAGTGTHTLPGSTVLYLPLKAPMRTRGVLAVEPAAWRAFAQPALRRQVDAFCTLIAIAIERLHYVEVAQQALLSMESERLRSSLLAAVSHDLRTPLTGLIGMAETLRRAEPPLAPSVADTVDAMLEQARRMRTMVVNLLDMARLQSRDVPMHRAWQSVEELVGSSLAAMREALSRHRVEVADLSRVPLVECDAVLIERVLCNLLENAGKYTPAGTTIRVSAEAVGAGEDGKVSEGREGREDGEDSEDGKGGVGGEGEIRIAVEDEGPGVPAGSERQIFAKFTRGQRESATAGVGLGLAVCEAIVQAHGGEGSGSNRRGPRRAGPCTGPAPASWSRCRAATRRRWRPSPTCHPLEPADCSFESAHRHPQHIRPTSAPRPRYVRTTSIPRNPLPPCPSNSLPRCCWSKTSRISAASYARRSRPRAAPCMRPRR